MSDSWRSTTARWCTAVFDFKRRTLTLANAGLPYPIRKRSSDLTGGEPAAQIVLPGVPLGSFSGSNYDEVVLDIKTGDLFVFFSDGVTEAVGFAAARIRG